MRTHRVVVLDVLTKHPPEMLFVDRDDMVETLAPELPRPLDTEAPPHGQVLEHQVVL